MLQKLVALAKQFDPFFVSRETLRQADLTVLPCEGWRREDRYDRSGLLWVNTSPNMRSLTEAMLSPARAGLAMTNPPFRTPLRPCAGLW